MRNTITIIFCQKVGVSFAVANILTVKIQRTKVPVAIDERNGP